MLFVRKNVTPLFLAVFAVRLSEVLERKPPKIVRMQQQILAPRKIASLAFALSHCIPLLRCALGSGGNGGGEVTQRNSERGGGESCHVFAIHTPNGYDSYYGGMISE